MPEWRIKAKGFAITHEHTLIKLAIPCHLVGHISCKYIHAVCRRTGRMSTAKAWRYSAVSNAGWTFAVWLRPIATRNDSPRIGPVNVHAVVSVAPHSAHVSLKRQWMRPGRVSKHLSRKMGDNSWQCNARNLHIESNHWAIRRLAVLVLGSRSALFVASLSNSPVNFVRSFGTGTHKYTHCHIMLKFISVHFWCKPKKKIVRNFKCKWHFEKGGVAQTLTKSSTQIVVGAV